MQQINPQNARQLVKKSFQELHPSLHNLTVETLLIREGHYCGHRYQCGGMSAVWFLEENQIKIYEDSHLLRVISPRDVAALEQKAA